MVRSFLKEVAKIVATEDAEDLIGSVWIGINLVLIFIYLLML